jgi:ADP-heptose:LPS heptosyltransferase
MPCTNKLAQGILYIKLIHTQHYSTTNDDQGDIGLAKPYWLKTTVVKAFLSQVISKCFYHITKFHYRDGHAILIISTDGLGDAFLRFQLVNDIIERHDGQPVYILTRGVSQPVYEHIAIRAIVYNDRHKTNPIKRIMLVHRLNKIGFEKNYVLDFICNENIIELIKCDAHIGFAHRDNKAHDRRLTLCIPKREYVGHSLSEFCQQTGLSGFQMDNRKLLATDANNHTEYNGDIILAIGASNRSRMMQKSNMLLLISHLLDKITDKKIIIVGHGTTEKNYADWLSLHLQSDRVINQVNQFDIKQLIRCVYHSSLLIGFDSALYNLSFTLRKPTICLAADNHLVLHHQPWVEIVHGDKSVFGTPDGLGCEKTNSITADQLYRAYLELTRHQ